MKITKVMMDRTKNDVSKLDINLVTVPKITKISERCKIGNVTQEKCSIVNTGKFISTPRAVEIENARQNFIISLHNLQEKFVASIGLKADKPDTLGFALGNIVNDMRERMKHSYDNVIAFVTGGIHYDGNPKGDISRDLMDAIYRTLVEEEHVPTTVLAEQKIDFYDKSKKGLDFYSARDFVNVYDGIINDLRGTKPENEAEVEKLANEIFDFVEISKEAPVKIMDKEPITQFNLKKKSS